MKKILVTGALGQIGCELVAGLRKHYGNDQVIASDIRMHHPKFVKTKFGHNAIGDFHSGENLFEHIDCTQHHQLHEVVKRHEVGTIYHLAALLSAVAEEKPQTAWAINMEGLYNVLEVARQCNCSVFFPSSIGAFGPSTPRQATPQTTIQRPNTMYGITKVSGELLCDYYYDRFSVDTRGIRLPGLISYSAPPGGGTTDYAVEIFRQAIQYRHYTCFLRSDTRLDMMYMSDAVRAMIELMEADPRRLVHRNAFNLTAMSITPEELAQSIRRSLSDFEIDYDIDPIRQSIADSWPQSVDDSEAQEQWDWRPEYDLDTMCDQMLEAMAAISGTTTDGSMPGTA